MYWYLFVIYNSFVLPFGASSMGLGSGVMGTNCSILLVRSFLLIGEFPAGHL